MPRIIAGRFKGLKLTSPQGLATRPTADQIKEALFSMILSLPFDLQGVRVLDLFAGSGSLGLEALSRGAASAVFVDGDPAAIGALTRNLSAAKLGPDQAVILKARWPQALTHRSLGGGPFDLLLLDPPYGEVELPLGLLMSLATAKLVQPGALAVWEQSPTTLTKLEGESARPWILLKTRIWGKKGVAFWQLAPENGALA